MNNEFGTVEGAGAGGFMMGMLWGVIIGGVVALLFAPQTGSETRHMIQDRLGQMKEIFRSSAREMEHTAEKTAEQVKQSAREMGQGM